MSAENLSDRPYEVLVVEDNAADMELFLRLLRKAQLEMHIEINAHSVSTGAEAAARLKERTFDAIFLDIGMPPPDGMELTKQIRSQEMNRSTAVVVISGGEDRGLMNRAFQAGATFFLFKPVDRMRLLRLIQISRVPIDRERRKRQRVKIKCKVALTWEHTRIDGETVNLSLNGMLVHVSRVLPIGTTVEVSLVLPAESAPTHMTARVARLVGNEFMGVHFTEMDKAEADRLTDFLLSMIMAAVEKGA